MWLALTFSLRHIVDRGGISVSAAGLLVVFAGLGLVTLFIAWLPAILERWDRLLPRRTEEPAAERNARDEAAALEAERTAAIVAVLEHVLTPEDGSAVQRITIRRADSEHIWRDAPRVRGPGFPSSPRHARR